MFRLAVQSCLARVSALLVLGALASCGGGGGGDGSGGGGGAVAPLVYTGNTNPARITATNAAQLTAGVLGGANASAALSSAPAGAEASGARELARRIVGAWRAAPLPSAANRQGLTSEPIDTGEQPCESGSVRTLGDISSTSGSGTLNITWSACRTGDITLNGTGTAHVATLDFGTLTITDGTLTFQRLSVSSSGGSGDVSGTIRLQVSLASNTATARSDTVALQGSRMTKTENFVVVNVYDDILSPTFYRESISGNVFDSVHGFVEVRTDAPLLFSTLAQQVPTGGQILLIGAANTQAIVIALLTAVAISVDLDGNGSFDIGTQLAWKDLTGPVGSDLADSDGDLMHNGWETANGLNPFDPTDAGRDSDGDGVTNLFEYFAGTNPNDPASRPLGPPPPPPPPSPPAPT